MKENTIDKSNTKKTRLKKEENDIVKTGKIFAYCIIIPALLHFLVFYVYINFSTITLAFTIPVEGKGEVFSLYNFQKFFTNIATNGDLVQPLLNTLKYFAVNISKTVLSAVIAYFFFKKVYLHKVYKIIFFIPSMIPSLVYVIIFKNLINASGLLGEIFYNLFGYEMEPLLGNAATATPTILFYVLWHGFGAQMLIFVGVMNRIPQSIIEAANLDGCSSTKEFFLIVMPLIWETLATYLLIGISCIFMASGPLLYFTGEDNTFNTYTLSFWIFSQTDGNDNYPAAIGIIFTVLALPLMFISRYLMSKIETVTY